MDSAPVALSTRSHRQALEWSLALLSQGIESELIDTPEPDSWSLLIAPEFENLARETLRLYEEENRNWPWRPPAPRQRVTFDWACLGWVFLLAVFHLLGEVREFREPGTLSAAAVRGGEWWRCFTATWLHADIGHLAGNAAVGALLLGLALGRYGAGVGLLAASLAGACANALRSLMVPGSWTGLGASGVVMAALGLLAAQYIPRWRSERHRWRHYLGGMAAAIMLFVLLGVAPGSDVLVHAFGLGFGALFGAILSLERLRAWSNRGWVNGLSGAIFVVLVIVPWWLAWRHG